jgi:MbtH protein
MTCRVESAVRAACDLEILYHSQHLAGFNRRRGEVAMPDEQEDTTIYKVVINHEEQYSIWPAYKENPLGWTDVGKSGTKDECLAYIKEIWTDMRPLSLRKKMQEQGLG